MNGKNLLNPIGIMQGRLSPPVGGRIQAFPVETWSEEFSLAREAGLDCIEWIYEADTESANPLRTDEGIAQVRLLAENSGVAVWSICADYYMTERLVTSGGVPRENAMKHLIWLLQRASLLNARYIVLPFVDESSLQSPQEVEGLTAVLESVLSEVGRTGVELHLETDLVPADLMVLLKRISSPLVRMNYDIGNSAALGHDPMEELMLLGSWLGSVHVKDRLHGGNTVPLGTGAADFTTCFRIICSSGFRGPFVLQAAREEGVNEVSLAIRNREFVEKQIDVVMR